MVLMKPGGGVAGVALRPTADEELHHVVPDRAVGIQNPRASQLKVQLQLAMPLQL